ncbi:procathepsin L-like isoform X1 [Bolinopsis microptera]|uniref:procathepsin L-like isoform X1 n=1 Tax=Bolinopsis microptera TaxID=2820187 RepID=UPI00307AE88F
MRSLSILVFLMLSDVAVSTFKLSNREIAKEYREALKKFATAPQNSEERNLQGTLTGVSSDDKAARRSSYMNFKKFAEKVYEINHDDTSTFTAKINKFSIEPESDFNTHFGMNMSASFDDEMFDDMDSEVLIEEKILEKREAVELPESIDWRYTMSEVAHQRNCGSCWAFCAISSVESAYYRATGLRKKFSFQELLDCVFEEKQWGNGCKGASINTGFLWVTREKRLASREDYKYVAKDGECKKNSYSNSYTNAGLKRLYRVPKTEKDLMEAVVEGVVGVGIKGGRSLLAYDSGIYYDKYLCRATAYPNHAVNLVGYGEKGGEKYWLLRNSWGKDWGIEGGHWRMTRDYNNHCKIHETALRLDLQCKGNLKQCEEQKKFDQKKAIEFAKLFEKKLV